MTTDTDTTTDDSKTEYSLDKQFEGEWVRVSLGELVWDIVVKNETEHQLIGRRIWDPGRSELYQTDTKSEFEGIAYLCETVVVNKSNVAGWKVMAPWDDPNRFEVNMESQT